MKGNVSNTIYYTSDLYTDCYKWLNGYDIKKGLPEAMLIASDKTKEKSQPVLKHKPTSVYLDEERKKLMDYLKSYQVSQDEFAALIGVSQSTINRYLSGGGVRAATENKISLFF